ncbi:hypothetical protein XELAEV_18034699mg [Xenopus laevis]|uniref:Uncharacterized protein n=1 Tax=Xenopus laevis TaxID=8355 RepID=A0A974CFD8_XENLA|nr:hypothetical protein XELAEV_18034699mg [Xenopus laevis]
MAFSSRATFKDKRLEGNTVMKFKNVPPSACSCLQLLVGMLGFVQQQLEDHNANNISDGTKPLGNGTPQNPAELQRQQRGNSYTKINMQKRCGKEVGKDNDSGRSSLSPPQISEVTGDCSPENTFFSAMVEEESHILC